MIDNAINKQVNQQIKDRINDIESFKYPNHDLVNVENLNVWIQMDLTTTLVPTCLFDGEGMFKYKTEDGNITDRFRFSGCVELKGLEVVSVKTPPFTIYKK